MGKATKRTETKPKMEGQSSFEAAKRALAAKSAKSNDEFFRGLYHAGLASQATIPVSQVHTCQIKRGDDFEVGLMNQDADYMKIRLTFEDGSYQARVGPSHHL